MSPRGEGMTASPQSGLLRQEPAAIAAQADQARSVAELKSAALRVDALVQELHAEGVAIGVLMRSVSELNTHLFARLWSLLAPQAWLQHSCLLAMGSEGRGEQILKTDQDNALLLRDGADFPGLSEVAARFNGALVELGWPRCPGDIMVSNPLWRQPVSAFRETVRSWIYGHDPEGPLRLAIFFDAAPKAGDAALLAGVREHLERIADGADTFLARFAAAADQFAEPAPSWLARLFGAGAGAGRRAGEQPLDLKKLGTFPIVHGVRALALQSGVRSTATSDRLAALVAAGRLDAALARDAGAALERLIGLRLAHQLRRRERGQPVDNAVRPAELAAPEREALRESLAAVKRFRAFLRQHFRLDAL